MRYKGVYNTNKERLPMQENYTEELKFQTHEEQVEYGPKLSTINFLKQFARVYTVTAISEPGLEGFFAN